MPPSDVTFLGGLHHCPPPDESSNQSAVPYIIFNTSVIDGIATEIMVLFSSKEKYSYFFQLACTEILWILNASVRKYEFAPTSRTRFWYTSEP